MEIPELSEYQIDVLMAIAQSGNKTFIVPDPSLYEDKKRTEAETNLNELLKLVDLELLSNVTESIKALTNDETKGKFWAFTIEYHGLEMFKNYDEKGAVN